MMSSIPFRPYRLISPEWGTRQASLIAGEVENISLVSVLCSFTAHMMQSEYYSPLMFLSGPIVRNIQLNNVTVI